MFYMDLSFMYSISCMFIQTRFVQECDWFRFQYSNIFFIWVQLKIESSILYGLELWQLSTVSGIHKSWNNAYHLEDALAAPLPATAVWVPCSQMSIQWCLSASHKMISASSFCFHIFLSLFPMFPHIWWVTSAIWHLPVCHIFLK